MRFAMTPEDFLKGRLVPPGFYPAVISSFEEKMSAGGPDPKKPGQMKESSAYIEMQFKLVTGEYKGTILYQNFSEKAPGFLVPLLEALGAKIDKSKPFAVEPTRDQFLGKTVDIHVVRGSWNNKPKNEIDGYKAYSGPAVTTAPASAGV